jgi:hypothetical protein
MPVDAFGSVLADGRLACFFCVICFILVRTIYGGLAGAAPSPDSRVALTQKGLLDGKRRFRLLWNCAVRRRVDQKAALGRGGKEHAAARQKHSLNSNAWMDYTPV